MTDSPETPPQPDGDKPTPSAPWKRISFLILSSVVIWLIQLAHWNSAKTCDEDDYGFISGGVIQFSLYPILTAGILYYIYSRHNEKRWAKFASAIIFTLAVPLYVLSILVFLSFGSPCFKLG